MRINLTSVLVDDQAKALHFYTDVLGFEKKNDVPLGHHRWLTVVSPDDRDGPELVACVAVASKQTECRGPCPAWTIMRETESPAMTWG